MRRSRLCLKLAFERQKPVSDSHARRGRRCASEAWDDTEVIPPFMNDPAAPCAQSARQRQSRLGGRCSVGAHICGGSCPCLKLAVEFANQLPNPSTLRRRRCAPESWDGGGAPSLPFGTKGASNAQSARQRPSKINGRTPRCRGPTFAAKPPLSGTRMLLVDGAARLNLGTAAARHPYHLERRGRRTRNRRGSAQLRLGGRCSVGAHFCGGSRPCP